MTLFIYKKKTPLQQCIFAYVCLKLWVLMRKKYLTLCHVGIVLLNPT